MGKTKINKDQEGEICKLYECDNVKSPKLAQMFGVTISTVTKYLKKNGIEIKVSDASPGDKFGRWTVIKEAKRRGGNRYFVCECSCPLKTRSEVRIGNLISGWSQSCGCLCKENSVASRLDTGIDYTGQTFGRLTILYEIERSKCGKRQIMAQCSCDGNIDRYFLHKLIGGQISCGCYNREKLKEKNTHQIEDYKEKHPLFCKIEEIRDKEDGLGIEVKCKNSNCGKWFQPTQNQIYSRLCAIEKPNVKHLGVENNFYCSDNCKHSCILYNAYSDPNTREEVNLNQPTSYELAIWREEVLKRQCNEYGYNFCIKCQGVDNLAAHHIDPKKIEPFFALDPENGFVACYECHDDFHKGECSTGKLANKVCK